MLGGNNIGSYGLLGWNYGDSCGSVLPPCSLTYKLCVCNTGAVHGTSWELEKVRSNVTLAMLTLAVISVVASLGVFGKDRLVFWRESASGVPMHNFGINIW